MRKNLIFIFILCLLILSVATFAYTTYPSSRPGTAKSTIWQSLYKNILEPVFYDFGRGDKESVDMVIFFRIAFGLVLFFLLYGVSAMALQAFPSNLRVALTLVIAILSVVLIPPDILISTGKTYGIVFFALLLGVPIAGGGWLMFTRFHEKTAGNYVMKTLICFIMSVLLGQFAGLDFGIDPAWNKLNEFWNNTAGVAEVAAAFLFFVALWFLFRAIFWHQAGAGTFSHSFGRGWFGNRVMLPHGSRQAQALQSTGLAQVNLINTHASARNLPGIQGALANVNNITQDLSIVVTTISVDIAGVTDPAKQARLQAAFAPLQTAETNVRNEVNGLQRHAAILAAPNPPANAWPTLQAHASVLQNNFNTAIRQVEQIARILQQP